MITESIVATTLAQLLEATKESMDARDPLDHHGEALASSLRRIRTYEEAGMLTRDTGFVVYLDDGSEYQVTVLQRR